MSLQRPELPIRTNVDEHAIQSIETKDGEAIEQLSLDLDPFAAPNVYYGGSHTLRKVAKSRTYSAVRFPLNPNDPDPFLWRSDVKSFSYIGKGADIEDYDRSTQREMP